MTSGDREQNMTSTIKEAPSPRQILVVEDELMIQILLEDMLAELGYTVVAAVGRIDEAMTLARSADFDMAILDVNLHGETVSPVAEVLAERGVPFVFATGYTERGVPQRFRDRPIVQKPFQQENLGRIMSRAFANPPG
jgi:CheY-like chemotaxis protein